MSDRDKYIIIAKNNILPKSREGKNMFEANKQRRKGSGEEGMEKLAASVMIVSTAPNKESRSRKRKREMEKGSASALFEVYSLRLGKSAANKNVHQGSVGRNDLPSQGKEVRHPPSYQTPRGPADSSGKTKAINGSRTSTILMSGGFLAAGPGKPAYWVQLLLRAGDVERNPGPETYVCPICGKEIKDRRQISVWCHLGGYVHMKCTSLRSIKGYSDEFVCDRCSWCKGEGGKREIRERRRTEKRKRREKVQKTRAEKREKEAKTKVKGKATRVWTWNIQGARFSFPRRNRFAEILRCISKSNAEVVLLSELREKEEGMKWIKAKDTAKEAG